MISISSRVAALEKQTAAEEPLVILVHWLGDPSSAQFAEVGGVHVARRDGESYEDFKVRLRANGLPGKPLVVFLGGLDAQ